MPGLSRPAGTPHTVTPGRYVSQADLDSRIPQISLELLLKSDAAVRAGAGLVEQRAKSLVPVRTGALRDAIHVEKEGEGEYAVVAGDTTGDNEVFYGHIVEYGSMAAAPHPFLSPAFFSSRQEILGIVQAALRNL